MGQSLIISDIISCSWHSSWPVLGPSWSASRPAPFVLELPAFPPTAAVCTCLGYRLEPSMRRIEIGGLVLGLALAEWELPRCSLVISLGPSDHKLLVELEHITYRLLASEQVAVQELSVEVRAGRQVEEQDTGVDIHIVNWLLDKRLAGALLQAHWEFVEERWGFVVEAELVDTFGSLEAVFAVQEHSPVPSEVG